MDQTVTRMMSTAMPLTLRAPWGSERRRGQDLSHVRLDRPVRLWGARNAGPRAQLGVVVGDGCCGARPRERNDSQGGRELAGADRIGATDCAAAGAGGDSTRGASGAGGRERLELGADQVRHDARSSEQERQRQDQAARDGVHLAAERRDLLAAGTVLEVVLGETAVGAAQLLPLEVAEEVYVSGLSDVAPAGAGDQAEDERAGLAVFGAHGLVREAEFSGDLLVVEPELAGGHDLVGDRFERRQRGDLQRGIEVLVVAGGSDQRSR